MELLQDVHEIIYLDSAATVYPKPREILEKAMEIYCLYGVNPGRSGYDLCMVGGNIVQETRERMASFFGGKDPNRLCFTYNASDALNLLIYGLLDKGDHAITTNLEHNSVIRPLNHLKRDKGVDLDYLKFGSDGLIDPDDLKKTIRKDTKLVVVNHGSNVIGAVQPVAEIGRICRERGILFVVDSAQTAGVIPIDVEEMCIDALAFTGHKSLLAPTGIGGLYVREGVEVKHTRAGGTGVKSAHPYHLDEYPFRLEVGTGNLLGILGLLKAQDYLDEHNINKIYAHEMGLFTILQKALSEIEGVTLHGTTSLENRLPVLSLSIAGLDPSDVGTMLDVDYNIATRTGLQCAPIVHQQMGTAPRGTVRMSVGPMNKQEHIDAAIKAVVEIAAYGLRK
jgi:cysteine desulfurase family protein